MVSPDDNELTTQNTTVNISRSIVIFNWVWCGLSITSGSFVAVLSGWTLLHRYTPLFFVVIGVFGVSLLAIPASLTLGLWKWRKGQIHLRIFLLGFLVPHLLAGVGFGIAYFTEAVRYH